MIRFHVLDTVGKQRGELFPLLKPFVKGEGFTDAERVQLYGVSDKDWHWVEAPEEADVFILPMSWNFYVHEHKLEPILELLEVHKKWSKPIWTFTSGDFGVSIPDMEGVTVFRANGNRSQLSKWHKGMPVFIEDPLQKYYTTNNFFPRMYQPMPIIGFCGQADGSRAGAVRDVLRTLLRNVKYYIGMRKELPQPLISTTRLRAQLLAYCEKSLLIETYFIKRKKYRAGAQSQEDRMTTTQEFYDTIRDSDYTLCVRGGGNFSVRLYETLAMGRIPVLVDTDCLLPFQNEIDWKNHIVWVNFNDRSRIADKIIDFHRQLEPGKFIEMQSQNRKLWDKKLQLDAFFKSYL